MSDELAVLDSVISNVHKGITSDDDLLAALWEAEIVVSSSTPVRDSMSDLTPLTFGDGPAYFVAVFTHPDRIGEFGALAPYFLQVRGSDVMASLDPQAGLVVNPGSESFGFTVAPTTVQRTVSAMRTA
jgi:hypothetical protein